MRSNRTLKDPPVTQPHQEPLASLEGEKQTLQWRLSSIPIWARILGLVGIALVVFTGSMVVHGISDQATQHSINDLTTIGSIQTLTKDSELLLKDLQLAYQGFAADPVLAQERYAENADALVSFIDSLEGAADSLDKLDRVQSQLDQVRTDTDRLIPLFQTVATAKPEPCSIQ